jgi:DNA-binding transcriptional LysR family regulator
MQLHERIGRRLRLRDLNVFLVVATERNMSKAAVQLAISQPAVSKAITEMELTLGVPLLDRGPRGVEPTLFGRALLKRSAAIFDELRQTVTDIDSLLDPTAGEARIGTAGTLATGLVPAVIERLTRQHPRLSFYLVEGAPATLQRELRERNVELLVARALPPLVDDDLELEVLFNGDRLSLRARGANGPVGERSRWSNCSTSPGSFLRPVAYRRQSFPTHSSPRA